MIILTVIIGLAKSQADGDGRQRRTLDIGGHPALNLLNTRPMGEQGPVERLATFADLTAFCVRQELMDEAQARRVASKDADAALKAAHAMREVLRSALEAQVEGREDWGAISRRANQAMARSPVVQRIQEVDGQPSFVATRSMATPDDVLALLAEQIARFIASPERQRARSCEADDCVLWFVDKTRNNSRHWCRMETCGARTKARTYYRKRRALAGKRGST